MKLPLYQIDAFTDTIFTGNPACVVPLEKWLPDEILLKIAKENAVAETAYFINNGTSFHLRWFTPEIEMDLCGHATLAASHVIKEILNFNGDKIIFETLSGELSVKLENSLYILDFPSRNPVKNSLPALLKEAIDYQPDEVLKARDYVLVYSKEEDVKNLKINRIPFDKLQLGTGGVIFTAPGKDCDFVSRFFTPGASVFEDPVTGSAHCSLIPYWGERFGKSKMTALQISERGGKLLCENSGDRVFIGGKAITYFKGELRTE